MKTGTEKYELADFKKNMEQCSPPAFRQSEKIKLNQDEEAGRIPDLLRLDISLYLVFNKSLDSHPKIIDFTIIHLGSKYFFVALPALFFASWLLVLQSFNQNNPLVGHCVIQNPRIRLTGSPAPWIVNMRKLPHGSTGQMRVWFFFRGNCCIKSIYIQAILF